MATTGLRDRDRLNGASNFGIRKAKMQFLLDEHDLKEFVTNVMSKPADPQQLATFKKEMAKAKRMVLDGVRDHIVPHITDKNMEKDMWDVAIKLYENPSENHKMILKEKLRTTKMQMGQSVRSYLTRIQTVRDELVTVSEKPEESELVQTLNNFTEEWHTLVQVISRRDTLPGWDRLWSDFTQEELRLSLVAGINSNNKVPKEKEEEDEENIAFASKGKEKKGPIRGKAQWEEKRRRKTCRRSSASGVVNLATASPNVLNGRGTRSKSKQQLQQRSMS